MGRNKKRNPPSSTSPAGDGGARSSAKTADGGGDNPESPPPSRNDVVAKYKQAVTDLCRGHQHKVLRRINYMCQRHGSSALVHRAGSAIFFRAAARAEDAAEKLSRLRSAAKCAGRAAFLDPSSLEFAFCNAHFLYEVSLSDGKGFEEALRECERALALADPAEPSTAVMHRHLGVLMEKCNDSSFTTRVKKLGRERGNLSLLLDVPTDIFDILVNILPAKNPRSLPAKNSPGTDFPPSLPTGAQRPAEQAKSPDINASTAASGAHRPAKQSKPSDTNISTAASAQQMDRVRSYWDSISADVKLGFLEVDAVELSWQYSDDKGAFLFLLEALGSAKANTTWKCWACCRCGDWFGDCESHLQHTIREHVCRLLPPLLSMLLQELPVIGIFSGDWKPIDAPSAVTILQDLTKAGPESSYVYPQWALADDAERTKLLGRIQVMLRMLAEYKCLSHVLLRELLLNAKEEIQSLASGSLLLSSQLENLPLYIRILGAPQLREVFKLLRAISHSCGFGSYCKKDESVVAANHVGHESGVLGGLYIHSDASKLILDLPSLQGELGSSPNDHTCNADALVSWLFSSPSSGEQLSAWSRTLERTSYQSMEILHMIQKEYNLFLIMCEEKNELLRHANALVLAVENLFRQRDHAAEPVLQSLAVALKKCQEEFARRENDVYELDAIANILKEAQALEASQSGHDETSSSTTSNPHELDSCIEEAIRIQEEQLRVELSLIDARIMQNLDGLQQLALKIGTASAFDHRTVVIPLVKSFLQLHVVMGKDAGKNSENELEDDTQRNSVKERAEVL